MANSSPKKTQLLGFLVFALLLVGLSLAMLFLNRSQDIRQQAFVGSSDVGDFCPGGDCVDESSATTQSGEYFSQSGVYSLNYDPATWTMAEVPPAATVTDQEQSFFVSKSRWGFATIYLTASPFSAEQRTMNVQQFADDLEAQIQDTLADNVVYDGKEVILIGDKEALRFDYTETILGKEAQYHEYVIWGDDHYLEAEVRSSATTGMNTVIGEFLSQIQLGTAPKVKGVSTEGTLNELELSELVKPSVANVLYVYCKEITVRDDVPRKYLQAAYPFCNGAYGSGFIVGGGGLIATNGHVVTTYPEEDFVMGFSLGHPAFVEFAIDFVRELTFAQGVETTPEEGRLIAARVFQDPVGVQVILATLFELFDQGYYIIDPIEGHHYVNLGTEPFEFISDEITPQNISNFVIDKTAIFPAEVVGLDFANLFAKEVVIDGQKPDGSDVAILQIDATESYNYPSLKIGDASTLKEGEQILIFGFPGAVSGQEGGSSLLDYSTSSTKVTVTKGIVSSIKKDAGGRTLIQTDASIGHGNSGGPAFNQAGEVIGIATYGINEEVGTFNFLRDVGDLLNLGQSEGTVISTEPSETYQNWQSALGYFWQDRFTKSLDYLSLIAQSYPIHPTVNEVIGEAEMGIKEGRDVDLLFGINKQLVYFGGAGLALIALGVLVAMMLKKRNNRIPPSAPPSQPPSPPSPEQTMEAPQPSAEAIPQVTTSLPPVEPVVSEGSLPQSNPTTISA